MMLDGGGGVLVGVVGGVGVGVVGGAGAEVPAGEGLTTEGAAGPRRGILAGGQGAGARRDILAGGDGIGGDVSFLVFSMMYILFLVTFSQLMYNTISYGSSSLSVCYTHVFLGRSHSHVRGVLIMVFTGGLHGTVQRKTAYHRSCRRSSGSSKEGSIPISVQQS